MREEIILLRNKGRSYRQIGADLKLNYSTVRYIIKKREETGSVENKARSGRPKKLSTRDRRQIVRSVQNKPFTSAQSLANDIASSSGKVVCAQTVRNVLHNVGLHGRTARKKPFISEANREKRLTFAKEYVNRPIEFWKNIIFSDESKFNLFGSDGQRFVWRKPNTELQAKHVHSTVKHGGGHVMVWGCMAANGVGNLAFVEGTMKAVDYVKVLRDNLSSSASKLRISETYYFQQDNDPRHTAMKTKEWLLYNVRRMLKTPPQSPDINPVENLWHLLNLNLRKMKILNKNNLKCALVEK